MERRIDLIWLGSNLARPPEWRFGDVRCCDDTPQAVRGVIDRWLETSCAEAWLFWDARSTLPDLGQLHEMLDRPGDLWHGGLALGHGGLPGIIDFIAPTWMLNKDPAPEVLATSWRVSLRACLVRTSLLRWGQPSGEFETLAGAALEWGHRIVIHGGLPRSHPTLIPTLPSEARARITLEDELRFARSRFTRRWVYWAVLRAAMTGYRSFEELGDALLATRATHAPEGLKSYLPDPVLLTPTRPSVTVLIPTLDRQTYLRTLLGQLRNQTSRAQEIVVVDQTEEDRRDRGLAVDFADLPLHMIALAAAGQCTARNAGLTAARGEAVLFLDDDDEIEADLIARHIDHLATSGADVSSGVAYEPPGGALPEAFTRARVSDVFPTNNTLARCEALRASGLFDLAFDHGPRADGDLGMRAYLSGAVMRLDPTICVLHHHAPRGGLRAHGARIVTYASSRRRVTRRTVAEVTELYRALRYFSPVQVRESIIQSALGTLSAHGSIGLRAMKAIFGMAMMPVTAFQLHQRLRAARRMLLEYPRIPALPPRRS